MSKSLKVTKNSILKMYSNKRYNLVINYDRTKILKHTRDIYLNRPLEIKACIRSNFRVPNSLKCKSKEKKCPVLLKCVEFGRTKVS